MDNLLSLIDKRIDKYFKHLRIPKEIPAIVIDSGEKSASCAIYGTCSTDSDIAAKVITVSNNANWELTYGSEIIVKFSATNTAQNPTLNVNNTGAKRIWNGNKFITTSGLSCAGCANKSIKYRYDGVQYVLIGTDWEERGCAKVRLLTDNTRTYWDCEKDMYLLNKTGEMLQDGDSVWVTYTGLLTADNAYISRRNGANYLSANYTAVDKIGVVPHKSTSLEISSSIYLRQTKSANGNAFIEHNISCNDSIFGCIPGFYGITSGDINQSIISGMTSISSNSNTGDSTSIQSSFLTGDSSFQTSYQSIGFGSSNKYPYLEGGSLAGGQTNYVNRVQESIISGQGNKFSNNVYASIISGADNSGASVYESLICGTNNSIENNYSYISNSVLCGSHNLIKHDLFNSMVCGYYHKIDDYVTNSLILGQGAEIPYIGYDVSGVYSEIRAGALIIGGGYNGGISGYSNAVIATGRGNVYITGNYNTNGADYAEIFEWVDGNLNNEDRRGLFVVLNNNKIRLANRFDDREDILGVVSAFPSVVGDACETEWHGKYETDIFGAPILVETEEVIEKNGQVETIKVLRKKISDDFDNTKTYIPRSQRPEYSYVGTMGKLVLVDDGTCEINGYCYPNINGIATKCIDKSKGYKVMERLDDSHIRVWIK